MKVLDKRLQTGVSILADMFMHSRFAQEDIDLERGVVLEEIDMYEDSPEDLAIDKLFEACYAGSALGRPILGTPETLQAINSEAMHDYMRRYYRPEDTVVAVSGHFTEDDLDYIADLFSQMEGEGRNEITPAAYRPSLVLREKDIEQNHLCLSFPGVSLLSEERYAMNLLSSILGGRHVLPPVPERARAQRPVLLGLHLHHPASGHRPAVSLHRPGRGDRAQGARADRTRAARVLRKRSCAGRALPLPRAGQDHAAHGAGGARATA